MKQMELEAIQRRLDLIDELNAAPHPERVAGEIERLKAEAMQIAGLVPEHDPWCIRVGATAITYRRHEDALEVAQAVGLTVTPNWLM